MIGSCLSVLILVLCSFMLSISVLMYGWGLSPQNWWWIVGGFIGHGIILGLIKGIEQESKR